MPLTRTLHWATQELHAYLVAHNQDTFSWGTNDCCLFAANAIQAMTGVDIASDFRDKYTTELGAMKAIKDVSGGSSVEDAAVYCATKHGLVEWSAPLLAQRGDLVLVQDADRLIAGVVHLNGKHVISIGEQGLKRLPLTSVTRAWKV